jgi:hypothetical protein
MLSPIFLRNSTECLHNRDQKYIVISTHCVPNMRQRRKKYILILCVKVQHATLRSTETTGSRMTVAVQWTSWVTRMVTYQTALIRKCVELWFIRDKTISLITDSLVPIEHWVVAVIYIFRSVSQKEKNLKSMIKLCCHVCPSVPK